MKFGHVLHDAATQLPELHELWLCYKQMKKQIKKAPRRSEPSTAHATSQMIGNEREFVNSLMAYVQRWNDSFLEQEEDCVIKMERFEHELSQATSASVRASLFQALVEFHGRALLIINWSALAYVAVVKLLKKHHKRTGLLLRAPEMRDLLLQPFCSTQTLAEIVVRAETQINLLQTRLDPSSAAESSEVPSMTLPEPYNVNANAASSSSSASCPPSFEGLNFDSVVDSGDSDMGGDMEVETDDDGTPGNLSRASSVAGPRSYENRAHEEPKHTPDSPSGGKLVTQMQVALRTWEYLKTNVSTPLNFVPQAASAPSAPPSSSSS